MREQLRALVKVLDRDNYDVTKIVTKDGVLIAYESPTCKWVCVEAVVSEFKLDVKEMGINMKVDYLAIPAFLVDNVSVNRGETFFIICDNMNKIVYESNDGYEKIDCIDGCFYALFKKKYMRVV